MPVEAARLDVVLGGSLDPSFVGTLNKAQDSANQLSQTFDLSTRHALGFSRGLEELTLRGTEGQLSIAGFFEVLRVGAREFEEIRDQTGSTTTAFKSLTGAIFSEETVILLVVTALATFISHLLSAKDAVTATKKPIDEYTKAMEAATKATAQQFDEVSKIVEQSKLHETTLGQQKTLLKQLQSINEEYFGSLKIENGLIVGLNEAYTQYADNILKVAKAKAASETVGKLTDDLLKTKQASFDIDKNFTNLNLTLAKTGEFIKGTTGKTGFDQMAAAAQRVSDILAKMYPTLQDIDFLTKVTGLSEEKIRLLLGDKLELKTKDAQLTAQILAATQLIGQSEIGQVATVQDKVKATETYEQTVEKLIRSLNALKKEFGTFDGITKVPFSPVVITESIKSLSQVEAEAALTKMRDTLQKAGKKVFSAQGILTDVPLLNDAEVLKNFDNLKSGIQETIKVVDTLSTAFQQMFTTILTGGKNAFKSVEQALVGLITKLIATVVEAALLSLILNSITGGSASIVGGAGFANLLKSLLGGGLKFNAEGGIFTGPTQWGNHIIGEKGPEALIPLDRLSSMMQGANNMQRVEVVGRISGNDIVLIQNRQNLRNNRNYGINFSG